MKPLKKAKSFRARQGEVVGGGFFVYRRGKHTNRVGVKFDTLPFEHPSFEAALQEATRLQSLNPNEKFCVFGELAKVCPSDFV